jgi:hypothetical protein
MDVNLCVIGVPGDSYRFWTPVIANGEFNGPFPVWRLPDSSTQSLIDTIVTGRADPVHVTIRVDWVIQTISGDLRIVAEQEVSAPGFTYDAFGYEKVTQCEVTTSGEDIHWECPAPTVGESLDEREEAGSSEEEDANSDDGVSEAGDGSR